MAPPNYTITTTVITIIIITCTFTPRVQTLKAPILPQDILPILPRQLSGPILRTLRSATDVLPTFVGAAAVVNNSEINWKGSCFYENTAWLELHNKSGSEFGGGTLHIKVSNAHSWTCMDLYIFATPYRVKWDYYFLSREHKVEFDNWEGKAKYEYVKNKGVAIFLMEAGMLGTIQALWEVFPLFTNTEWGENANLAFLEKNMGAKFEERPEPWVTNVNIDDIQSGDFLAISKIRGLWGGFETLEKWASGAYAGHSAVCLRDPQGKLWVGESGHEDEEGLELPEILVEVEKRGSSFAKLLTIPEQDDWTYVDGKSTSCVAFILEMYKEAGLFGDFKDYIQVTEFTIKDAYTLNFYENNSSRLPKWCNDGDTIKLPFCQITGKYRMELPGYNTIKPYPHMAENCPSMAPDYSRPKYC